MTILIALGLLCFSTTTMAQTKGKGQASPAPAETPKNIVATVNGRVITVQDFERALAGIPAEQLEEVMTDEGRARILNDLVSRALLLDEADRRKIAERPEVQAEMQVTREQILIGRLLGEAIGQQQPATDEEARDYYGKQPEEFTRPEQVRLSEIVVNAETDAKKISEQLKKKADFAALARERSQAPSASKGGDLGYVQKNQLLPALAGAAFDLKAGEVSDALKVQDKYFLLKVSEKTPSSVVPFDDVKNQIKSAIVEQRRAEASRRFQESLRKAAQISIDNKILYSIAPTVGAPVTPGQGK
jgi:peptidyl-prolyl cis-trans isomerase C